MDRDYSRSAVWMSHKMMTSLYSQNFKANPSKGKDERFACDGGVS
jgi:hypothetical protein